MPMSANTERSPAFEQCLQTLQGTTTSPIVLYIHSKSDNHAEEEVSVRITRLALSVPRRLENSVLPEALTRR
jgi:hypothetical protein